MEPEAIEQAMYDLAVRSKLRAPWPERLANLRFNRVITSGAVGAALACTLAMSNLATSTGNGVDGRSMMHPQVTDTDPAKKPIDRLPVPMNSDPVTASLAMSHID